MKKQFPSDIGAFWWLAQISRPDIFYAVHRCAKLVNKPTPRLGQRIQKIKNYLALTPSVGIVFQRHIDSPTLSGYVDAAFAAEDQAASRIGYFFLFRGNLVSWCSENTTRVMTLSTEVECRGLVQFGKENQWHRQFHNELNLFSVDKPTIAMKITLPQSIFHLIWALHTRNPSILELNGHFSRKRCSLERLHQFLYPQINNPLICSQNLCSRRNLLILGTW